MTEKLRKVWLPILLGMLIPAGNTMAQAPADSIVRADSVLLTQSISPDTLSQTVHQDSIGMVSDSVPAVTAPPKKKNALDAPVIYESSDSMVWDEGGYASLYGSGSVKYQNVELTAAIIKMQMDSSLVHADGYRDSSGIVQQ